MEEENLVEEEKLLEKEEEGEKLLEVDSRP